jgi:hypothetical protein
LEILLCGISGLRCIGIDNDVEMEHVSLENSLRVHSLFRRTEEVKKLIYSQASFKVGEGPQLKGGKTEDDKSFTIIHNGNIRSQLPGLLAIQSTMVAHDGRLRATARGTNFGNSDDDFENVSCTTNRLE